MKTKTLLLTAQFASAMSYHKRIAGCCVAAAMCVGSTVHETQAALIAQYKFEQNYLDSSGNGHTGTTSGSGSIVNDSERGWVYDNPDSSYVNIDSTVAIPTLPANGGVTLAAWVKRDNVSLADDGRFAGVISLGTSGDNPIMMMSIRNDGSLNGFIEGDGGADQVELTGPTGAISNEEWTHIAITFDRLNDVAKLYVDGAQSGSDINIALAGDGALDWAAAAVGGTDPFNANNFYQGLIDDARIYDDVLSASEILGMVVPEPSSIALMGLGGLALMLRRKRS